MFKYGDEKSQELKYVAPKEKSSVANMVWYPFQYQKITKDENVLKCPEPRCNSYSLTIQRGKFTICGSWGAPVYHLSNIVSEVNVHTEVYEPVKELSQPEKQCWIGDIL